MKFLKKFTNELWVHPSWRASLKPLNLFSWNAIALSVIFLLAAYLRFTGLMPNIKHPDEAYTEKVVTVLKESGQPNPHAFKYGSLHFYLNLAAVKTVSPILDQLDRLTGFAKNKPDLAHALSRKDTRPWVLDPWAMRGTTALVGAATVLVVYVIGVMTTGNKVVGLVAALVIAVSPLHVTNSHWITTDVLATLLLYLSFAASVRLWLLKDKVRLRDYLIAGLLVGLAASVRYQPLGIVPYLVAIVLAKQYRRPELVGALAGLGAAGLGFVIANPFFLFELPQVRYDFAVNILPWYKPHIQYWWGHIVPIPPFGFNLWYLKQLVEIGIGPTAAAMAAIGLAGGLLRRRSETLLLLSVSAPVLIVVMGYLGPTWDRLIIPALPSFAVLAGMGLTQLLAPVSALLKGSYASALTLFVAAALVVPQLMTSARASAACANPSANHQVRDWIEHSINTDQPIARGPLLSIPTERDGKPYDIRELTFDKTFGLRELQQLPVDYFILNAEGLTREFTWFNKGIIPDPTPGQYNYYYLGLRHWENYQIQNSGQTKRFVKGELCPDADVRIYRVTPEPKLALAGVVADYNMSEPTNANLWQLYGQQHLSLTTERSYPKTSTEQGIQFDAEAAQVLSFRLVGPELGIEKDAYYRLTLEYTASSDDPQSQQVAFANVEVFRKERGRRTEGELNAVSERSKTVNQRTGLTTLVRSPERGATIVPSLVFQLERPATVTVQRVLIEKLTAL